MMEISLAQLVTRNPGQGSSKIGSPSYSARSLTLHREIVSFVFLGPTSCRRSTLAYHGISSCLAGDGHTRLHGAFNSLSCRNGFQTWNERGKIQVKRLRRSCSREQIIFSGGFGFKLMGPQTGLNAKSDRFVCVSPRHAFPGHNLDNFTWSVDMTQLHENWSKLVASERSWEALQEGLHKSGQPATSASRLGSLLGESVGTSLRHVTVSYDEVVQKELGRLGQSAGTILSKGSEILHNVGTKFAEVTPSKENVVKELGRLEVSAATILSKGSEIVHNVTTKLGDATIPSQEGALEGLGHLEQSTAAILTKASAVLNDVTTKSVHLVPPTVNFQLLRQTSSNIFHAPAVELLGQSASRIISSAGALPSQFVSKLNHLTGDVVHLDTTVFSLAAQKLMERFGTSVGDYYDGFGASAFPVTATALITVAGSAVAIVLSNPGKVSNLVVEGEDLPLRYDPVAIGSFFKRRPLDIIRRSIDVMFQCSALTISILFDLVLGRAQENESHRAVQLVDLIARLGPTAIKIGQALSIRPDLLPVTYLEELQKLQDRVPPFSNEEARVLIFLQLGKAANEVFSEMSESPVAAASLGQVYKGRLCETGEIVAIKVQRPGVLEGISRDLFLLRIVANSLKVIPSIQSDLIALLDNWAFRFFDELDYVQEGKNAQIFAENMKSLTNVTVPAVYMKYTSRKVLTTQWIEGEKLSESRTDDLLPLVSTALNCYLVQLLESGFLHADPHPGNLLRTPDGRLCVLDYGLMTQVSEDQRYALIEYISHLVNSDYKKVAQDLVNLGFVPPDLENPEKTAAVVPQLSRILGQLVQGGGARKINFHQVTDDLASIAKDYVFVLPPYFALILRAFSVLEGLGLEADPDYSIVNECYPYISKRLLTDDSPRTRAALKDFLYGGKEQLDMQRVEDIIGGFQSFRDVMAPAQENSRLQQKVQVIDRTTKEALKLIFAPKGSYIQELLLTELVRSVDALSREAVAQMWQLIASTMRIPGIPLPAPILVPGSWPLPVPGVLLGIGPVARLSAEDQQSLDTVKRIWKLLEPSISLPSPAEMAEIVQEIVPLLLSLFPGVTIAVQRFNAMLLQRLALRFADDLDGTNSILEWNADPMASARHIQPLGIFSFQSVPKDGNETEATDMFQKKGIFRL